jgi:hypothetical protein
VAAKWRFVVRQTEVLEKRRLRGGTAFTVWDVNLKIEMPVSYASNGGRKA